MPHQPYNKYSSLQLKGSFVTSHGIHYYPFVCNYQDLFFYIQASNFAVDWKAEITKLPLVGRVGVEPTHQKGTDLQSAATLRLRRLPIWIGLGRSKPKNSASLYFYYWGSVSSWIFRLDPWLAKRDSNHTFGCTSPRPKPLDDWRIYITFKIFADLRHTNCLVFIYFQPIGRQVWASRSDL